MGGLRAVVHLGMIALCLLEKPATELQHSHLLFPPFLWECSSCQPRETEIMRKLLVITLMVGQERSTSAYRWNLAREKPNGGVRFDK